MNPIPCTKLWFIPTIWQTLQWKATWPATITILLNNCYQNSGWVAYIKALNPVGWDYPSFFMEHDTSPSCLIPTLRTKNVLSHANWDARMIKEWSYHGVVPISMSNGMSHRELNPWFTYSQYKRKWKRILTSLPIHQGLFFKKKTVNEKHISKCKTQGDMFH